LNLEEQIIGAKHKICLLCEHSNNNAQFCSVWKKKERMEIARTKTDAKCPLGKWENIDISKDICQYRTCGGCAGGPQCRPTGQDCKYGPGTFDQCKIWRETNRSEKRK